MHSSCSTQLPSKSTTDRPAYQFPLPMAETRRRERRAERARQLTADVAAPDYSDAASDKSRVELVVRPRTETAPDTRGDLNTSGPSNSKSVKPAGGPGERADTPQDAAPKARKARVNSLESKKKLRRVDRACEPTADVTPDSHAASNRAPVEPVARPRTETAPTTPPDDDAARASNSKPKKPAGGPSEKADTSQDAAQKARRARVDSLERKKNKRAPDRKEADPNQRRNPFDDPGDTAGESGSRQRRSSRRGDDEHQAATHRRERTTSRRRSRSASRARSRSRAEDRHNDRHNHHSSSRRGRSRGSSRSSTNRRRSRSARARSWLRGDSSAERAQSLTRVSHGADERSILFYEYARKQLSVEFVADEIRRGTWKKRDALYFRINVIIGRGKKEYFKQAWFKFSVRSHSDEDIPVSVVKYYPERILGPSTEESQEDAKNLDFGMEAGLPQPIAPVSAHVNAGRSGKGNMVVQHRCRFEVTPYRGSTGVNAHLWKQGTECVFPSRVQVQFVVLYNRPAGLDIRGKLDFPGTDGADGLWKKVSTRSWDRESKDFSDWTEADWKSNGDNSLLEG